MLQRVAACCSVLQCVAGTNNAPPLNMDQDIDRDIKLKVVEQALTMVKTLYRQPLPKPPPAAQGTNSLTLAPQ